MKYRKCLNYWFVIFILLLLLSFITLINTILRGEFTESLDSTRGLDLRFAHGLRDLFDRFHFFFDFTCPLFSISDQKIDDLFLGHGIKNDLDFLPSSSLNRSLSAKTRNRTIPFLTYPYSLPYPNLLRERGREEDKSAGTRCCFCWCWCYCCSSFSRCWWWRWWCCCCCWCCCC